MPKSQQQSLLDLLEEHDNHYYNEDQPVISDAQYDVLKAQVGEYSYVPGKASSLFQPIQHTHPILSLAKVNDVNSLRAEITRLWPVVVQWKIDGLTIVLYPDGKAATRGSHGAIGEDVTHTVSKIPGIRFPRKDPVRIEVYMPINQFRRINQERADQGQELFKNPRNAAAGMIRNKDASKVMGLSYYAYNIVGSSLTETDQLKLLKEEGFIVIPTLLAVISDGLDRVNYPLQKNLDRVTNFCVEYDRSDLSCEIDGLVIKSNLANSAEIFSKTGHHFKNAVAYKFIPSGQWTKLNSITWQVGRTGKLTPVAEVNPVDIGGSTISRVTLHNPAIIEALSVRNESEVFVIKANDVIPDITESRGGTTSIESPSICPDCSSTLILKKDQLFCPNGASCPAQLIGTVCHIASKDVLDIEGLSEETAFKMKEANLLPTAFSIFNISKEDILNLPGFAEKSAQKLYSAIQSTRNTELSRFICAAGISEIGRTASKDIANSLESFEGVIDDIKAGCPKISAIDGIGTIMVENLIANLHVLHELRKWVTPLDAAPRKTVQNQLSFVITGTLNNPRSYYEGLITSAGHKVSGGVSKNTSFVLLGDNPGSKAEKANALGIPCISEADLESYL